MLLPACAAAALAIAGCGGDDEDATTSAAGSEPDLERYCELVTEIDRSSQEIFGELGASGGVPSEEELVEAQRRVLEENEELIEEATAVVPDEIREDFELSLDSARERAEAGDASQPSREVADANLRLQKFVRSECPGGGGSAGGGGET